MFWIMEGILEVTTEGFALIKKDQWSSKNENFEEDPDFNCITH